MYRIPLVGSFVFMKLPTAHRLVLCEVTSTKGRSFCVLPFGFDTPRSATFHPRNQALHEGMLSPWKDCEGNGIFIPTLMPLNQVAPGTVWMENNPLSNGKRHIYIGCVWPRGTLRHNLFDALDSNCSYSPGGPRWSSKLEERKVEILLQFRTREECDWILKSASNDGDVLGFETRLRIERLLNGGTVPQH